MLVVCLTAGCVAPLATIVPEARPAWTPDEYLDFGRARDSGDYPHLASFWDRLVTYICANEALADRDLSDCEDDD